MGSWFQDWPWKWRFWLTASALLIASLIACLVVFSGRYDVSLRDNKLTVMPRETAEERECRLRREDLSTRDRDLNSRIMQVEAEMTRIDQAMRDTQRECLAEVSKRPGAQQGGCTLTVETQRMVTFATKNNPGPPPGASGHYQRVLLEMFSEKTSADWKLVPLKSQQEKLQQERQRLNQLCSGSKAQ